jgi:Putative prokaryotic signal transducing protein
MLDTNLLAVAAYASEPEAEMASGALESAGIESMILGDSAGGMEPSVAFAHGGYQLLVKEEDLATAKEMLEPRELPVEPGA